MKKNMFNFLKGWLMLCMITYLNIYGEAPIGPPDGAGLGQVKKSPEAIADFTKAIELDPKKVQAYYNRGIAYNDLKKYAEAIADFTKTIELEPKNVGAYVNRGNAYGGLGKYPEAIADYTKVIELTPKDEGAYYNRGSAYANLRKYAEAIADFTKAIELEPKNVGAYVNRGNAYKELKKSPEAIADCTKAIKLNPEYAVAYNNRGIAYNDLNKSPAAIADYTKAIELNPEYTDAYYNRGNAYYVLKKYPAAIADYTKAIELDPENAFSYNKRGDVYHRLKKYPEAFVDFTKALKLRPEYAKDYYRLGATDEELKKYPPPSDEFGTSCQKLLINGFKTSQQFLFWLKECSKEVSRVPESHGQEEIASVMPSSEACPADYWIGHSPKVPLVETLESFCKKSVLAACLAGGNFMGEIREYFERNSFRLNDGDHLAQGNCFFEYALEKRIWFLNRACEGNSEKGCEELTTLFSIPEGLGTPNSKKEDRPLQLHKAFKSFFPHYKKKLLPKCNAGDAQSCSDIAKLSFPFSPGESYSLAEKACSLNSSSGCRMQAYLKERGIGGSASDKVAKTYYDKACSLGDTISCDYIKSVWPDFFGAITKAAKLCEEKENKKACIRFVNYTLHKETKSPLAAQFIQRGFCVPTIPPEESFQNACNLKIREACDALKEGHDPCNIPCGYPAPEDC